MTNLFWDLAKIVDKSNGSCLFKWVINVVDVHLALIEEMVEDIDRFHRWRTLLLVTKDQVDPFMQMGADIVTLQSLKKHSPSRLWNCFWKWPSVILWHFWGWNNNTKSLFLTAGFIRGWCILMSSTSLWSLMNSLGSPFAHGGRITSPSLVPFCLLPLEKINQITHSC